MRVLKSCISKIIPKGVSHYSKSLRILRLKLAFCFLMFKVGNASKDLLLLIESCTYLLHLSISVTLTIVMTLNIIMTLTRPTRLYSAHLHLSLSVHRYSLGFWRQNQHDLSLLATKFFCFFGLPSFYCWSPGRLVSLTSSSSRRPSHSRRSHALSPPPQQQQPSSWLPCSNQP